VSSKRSSLLKNWLRIGLIAFGVSFGCALPFTQNPAQSALVGVLTIPGVGASMLVQSRQRQRHIHRQMLRGKLRLNKLQQQDKILAQQLQIRGSDYRAIEIQVEQLQRIAADLTDRIQHDRDRHQQLEQKISALALHYQEQEVLGVKLDGKVQDKQAQLLTLETDFNRLKRELWQLQAERSELDRSQDIAAISLQNLRDEIDRYGAMKRELEGQIQALQNQQQIAREDLDSSIDHKRLLLKELDEAIADRRQIQQGIEVEINSLAEKIATKSQQLAEQEQKLVVTRSGLNSAEVELQDKKSQLSRIAAEIVDRNNEIEGGKKALAQVELEIRDRQTELENLEAKIYAKLQEIDKIEIDLETTLRTFEPKPPKIERSIDPIDFTAAWQTKFIDNPHLSVLEHIEKHGVITEAEASSKLGNARSVRQFANKLEEYTQFLPFAIRVESSPKGNRYLKDT
jgi:chromosome segregation ATPase